MYIYNTNIRMISKKISKNYIITIVFKSIIIFSLLLKILIWEENL